MASEPEWPFDIKSYTPELDNGPAVIKKLNGASGDQNFSPIRDEPNVLVIRDGPTEGVKASTICLWKKHDLRSYVENECPSDTNFQSFHIRIKESRPNIRMDRLDISSEAFTELATRYHIPTGFIDGLLGHGCTAQIQGVRTEFDSEGNPECYNSWHIIRQRRSFPCTSVQNQHTRFRPQRDPLDQPYHVRHFNFVLQVHSLGVFFQYNFKLKCTTMVYVDFCAPEHSKFHRGELQNLLIHCLAYRRAAPNQNNDPFWIQLVHLKLALNYWKQTLELCGEEIAYATRTNKNKSLLFTELHDLYLVLRSDAEIQCLLFTIQSVITEHKKVNHILSSAAGRKNQFGGLSVSESLDEIFAGMSVISQMTVAQARQLKDNLDNLLGTNPALFQIENNRNAIALQNILMNTQKEVEQQFILTQQMKTVAKFGMLFLPAASIATILALPWFQDIWSKTLGIAIWFTSSALATAIAFFIYHFPGKSKKKLDTAV
ncbi:hypothetical protein EDC01DRAFT_640159 [Geopyxis carbonaria]|nr:hypothetical protein EDC01DRAFT_640159 [Geopyxis carbonaria]